MNKFFITTTLPYSNSSPHVGHLFEFVLGDIYASWFRHNGDYDVKFNIGLDENGTKILKKAKELNIPIEEYLEKSCAEWKKFCDAFFIGYNSFYRTSSKEHYDGVKDTWNYYLGNGDIYKKDYTGKYCFGCESFKTDKDLVNGKCPDHITLDLEELSETNYFFNLSKYKDSILKWLETNPIEPRHKNNELVHILNEYDELCISRKKTESTLGVDVPNDDSQVIYVWKDALESYLLAAKEYWNGRTLQLCGPDNLRFQAQIFQCFLSAADKKLTDKILIHGTILDSKGNKMSKSVGNVIDPIDQLNKYGVDAVRYYCAINNTYQDFNWDESVLKSSFNSHIVNGFGNLVSRTLNLIEVNKIDVIDLDNSDVVSRTLHHIVNASIAYNEYDIKGALEYAHGAVTILNQYINDTKPWETKDSQVLSNCFHLICQINSLYNPVFKDTCINIDCALHFKKKILAFERLK